MTHLELCKQTFDTIGLKYEQENGPQNTIIIRTNDSIDERHVAMLATVVLWFSKDGKFLEINAS